MGMETRKFGKNALAALMFLAIAGCGTGKNDYDASGVFEATEVIVSAEAYGRIMHFDVTEGMQLIAGQEVGYIDTTQLYLRKTQLLTNKKSVQTRTSDVETQIAATREQIRNAEHELQRTQNLLKANASTQKSVDDINFQISVLQKQLAAQLSTLQRGNLGVSEESSALEIQVSQLQDQLLNSRIVSPDYGTVLVKYAEAGELATQGKPLFKMANLNTMFLRAYLTSDQLSRIGLGQTVTVYADYGNKERRSYEGTVTWISDRSEFTPKTIQTRDERANLVYAVKIAVKNDGYLKIGMYGELKFSADE